MAFLILYKLEIMEQKAVVIFGATTIGKIAKEVFDENGVVTYCFLDDNEELLDKEIDDVVIMGSMEHQDIWSLIGKDCNAFIAIDETKIRKGLVGSLKELGTVPVNTVHNKASIAKSAHFEHGNFINAGATLNSFSKIGNHNIIHGNVLVDSGAEVGDYVTLGAGVIVNADCNIEDEVFVGSGAVLVSGIKIGKGARVGAGSVVVEDVPAGKTVYGNPAQELG